MKKAAKKVLKMAFDLGPNSNGDFVVIEQFIEKVGFTGSRAKALRKYMEESGYITSKPNRLTALGIEYASQKSFYNNLKNILISIVEIVRFLFTLCKLI